MISRFRIMAKLGKLKACVVQKTRASFCRMMIFASNVFKSLIGLVVYVAMIPLIMEMLESLSSTLTGTAGVLLSAIISIVPLLLVVKVLDKLNL